MTEVQIEQPNNFRDKSPQQLGEEFAKLRPMYEIICLEFHNHLSRLIADKGLGDRVHVIEKRTKDVKSFIDKIARPAKGYRNPIEEIVDLIGLRVITHYLDDVEDIGKLIKSEFEVDFPRSHEVDWTNIDPDRFGYESNHYIITLPHSLEGLRSWQSFVNPKAEIQVRTVVQHAWAAISHRLYYKKEEDVPKELRRDLFRLSALLEIADKEFVSLRQGILNIEEGYKLRIDKGDKSVEIDISSLKTYLDQSDILDRLRQESANLGIRTFEQPITRKELSELISLLRLTGINSIQNLDHLLKMPSGSYARILENFKTPLSLSEEYVISSSLSLLWFVILYIAREKLNMKMLRELGYESWDAKRIMKAVGKNIE